MFKVVFICGNPISIDTTGQDYALTIPEIEILVNKIKSAKNDFKQLTVKIKSGIDQLIFLFKV